jgi:D-arabinose 1-dehydrogenase-like Zn-dependent alcohol dehydrogenase
MSPGPGPSMRALRLHAVGEHAGSEDLRVDEVPTPAPSPPEVLVEVAACGIGARDLGVVRGAIPHGPQLPQILGHEAAGTIAAVGAEVSDWQPGDRVAVLAGRHCKRCTYCLIGRENLCVALTVPGIDRDGALAGHVLADPDLLAPIPAEVPFHEAAIVVDAVATPYHALKRAGLAEGSTLAIVGMGGLGMHALLLAKLWGAEVVAVDTDPVNLERAAAWGADALVDARDGEVSTRVRELTGGGVDRAIEFVGSAGSVDQAVRSVAPGGRTVVVGLGPEHLAGLPLQQFVARELEVAGSFGSTMQDVGELFDLLEDGRLDLSRSVTDTIDLAGVGEALRRLETRDGHPVRTVVTDLR